MSLVTPITYPRGLRGPIPAVVPLTIRENPSQQYLIEEMRHWIETQLIPFVNGNIKDLAESWVEETNRLIAEWERLSAALIVSVDEAKDKAEAAAAAAALAQQAAEAARDLAEQYASQAQAIQDQAIAGIVSDDDSLTRAALDNFYVAASALEAIADRVTAVELELTEKAGKWVEEIINTGRLSETALDAKYLATRDKINVIEAGAIGDGVADDTDAINAAIGAAPDFATILFPAGKTFKVNGTIGNQGKSLTFEAYGAKFVQGSANPIVYLQGEYEPSVAVSSITSVLIDGGVAANIPGIRVITSAPFNVSKGEVIKVYSDDPLKGTRLDVDPTPPAMYRAGQFGSVQEVSGNTITITGAMRDPMTTRVRVSRLKPIACHWRGGEFTGLTSAPSSLIQLFNMIDSSIEDTHVTQAGGQSISLQGNYGYKVRNNRLDFSLNMPEDGFFGYGVNANTNEFGIVESNVISMSRHAFSTTVSTTLVTDDIPQRHGREYGTRVSNNLATGGTSTAYDTHSNAQEVSFINNHADSSFMGYGIRGRACQIIGCSASNVRFGFRLFSDSGGGESYHHMIQGLKLDKVSERVGEVAVRFGVGHPNLDVLDRNPSFIDDLFVTDCAGTGLNITNATVRGGLISIKFTGAVPGKTFYTFNNSHFTVEKLHSDFVSTTGVGATLASVNGSNCILEADVMRVTGASALSDRLASGIQASGTPALRIADFNWDYLPSNADNVFPVASVGYCDYSATVGNSTNRTNYYRGPAANDANLIEKAVRFTRKDVITIVSAGTGAVTMATPPLGRNGQTMRIMTRGSGHTLIINSSANLSTASGSALTIPAFGSATFVYDSTAWRQV